MSTIQSTGHLLKRLRHLMQSTSAGPIHAYIVPSSDAHLSEYIADCDARRPFISKFTGSAGTAVVTLSKAALWTDGRYHLQASNELDPESWILMKDGLGDTPSQAEWLKEELAAGNMVGVDPFLVAHESWKNLSKELRSSNITLVGVRENLIDKIWEDPASLGPGDSIRPKAPSTKLMALDKSLTGKDWTCKVEELRKEMQKKKAGSLILTALDDIAWLLNLRGADIDFNPVFFAYCVVTMDQVYLFVNKQKLTLEVEQAIGASHFGLSSQDLMSTSDNAKHGVRVLAYEDIFEFVSKHLTDEKHVNAKCPLVWVSYRSSEGMVSLVPKARRCKLASPVTRMKAIKNEVEIENMRQCHIRDAAALCEYLAWLEQMVHEHPQGHAQLWEIQGADYLESCRKQQAKFMGLSFPTISSSGPNGAIIHYHPSEASRRAIGSKELYLVDSGAQYLDGTTDVTRTVHMGEPTPLERQCFTRVLKGHIQLAMAVFPRQTKGSQLDVLARQYLWSQGLEYLHGTGHGVGAFLNVHEGPTAISPRMSPDDPGMESGQVLSNEPGYYEDGAFGIRIESLVVTREAKTVHNFQQKGFLCFETITLVPIQAKMIDLSLMSDDELAWLNDYHAKCRSRVGKLLEASGKAGALDWLERQTRPLTR